MGWPTWSAIARALPIKASALRRCERPRAAMNMPSRARARAMRYGSPVSSASSVCRALKSEARSMSTRPSPVVTAQ